jgi:para-aminobenzoate synthetase / 4-amino-4-deoxychorismate lyase
MSNLTSPDEETYSADVQRSAAAGWRTSSKRLTPSSWHPLPDSFRMLAARDRRAVLLETAQQDKFGDKSLLFVDPIEELVAWTAEDLDQLLSQVDRHTSEGRFVAGFFNYECGEHFLGLSPRELASEGAAQPIAWLGVFIAAIRFDHKTGVTSGNLTQNQAAPKAAIPPLTLTTEGLQISEHDYGARLTRIREYLGSGDTYQVNFTDRICGSIDCEPLEIYQALIQQQPVPFAAYLNRPSGAILSFSPEMFYRVSQGGITARPMKGTWARGVNTCGDYDSARRLRNDEKNRSEHIMIVDLLRNDLGRLCEYGTVRVDDLFQVERYSTLLQMTSSISGVLRADLKPSIVFRTLFPSGSITGAPKRRTTEIIRELESGPRGIYTGAIGYFGPHGDACFNVAIRTLKLEDKKLTMGVGGGITADSVIQQEYQECQLKGLFLTRIRPPFSLIETMRCESGISLLDSHMQRLGDSADYFGIRYDRSALVAEITALASQCESVVSRIRLELNQNGSWEVSAAPLDRVPWNGRILLAPERIDSKDVFLHHKTTNRHFYERHLATARLEGFDEVLFLNGSSQFTEGAISNFFFRIDGQWLTPKLGCGVLPGIQRDFMLQNLDGARESEIEIEDLVRADRIFICNALRGPRSVHSIEDEDQLPIWKFQQPH